MDIDVKKFFSILTRYSQMLVTGNQETEEYAQDQISFIGVNFLQGQDSDGEKMEIMAKLIDMAEDYRKESDAHIAFGPLPVIAIVIDDFAAKLFVEHFKKLYITLQKGESLSEEQKVSHKRFLEANKEFLKQREFLPKNNQVYYNHIYDTVIDRLCPFTQMVDDKTFSKKWAGHVRAYLCAADEADQIIGQSQGLSVDVNRQKDFDKVSGRLLKAIKSVGRS